MEKEPKNPVIETGTVENAVVENEVKPAAEATAEESQNESNTEEFSDDADFVSIAKAYRKDHMSDSLEVDKIVINSANCNVREGEYGEFKTLVLTISKKVRAMVDSGETDELGNAKFILGVTNQVWIMANQFIAALSQNANPVIKQYAKKLKSLDSDELAAAVTGMTIDLFQIHVKPVTEDGEVNMYVNPFSSNKRAKEVMHEQWYSNVIKVHTTDSLIKDAVVNKAITSGATITLTDMFALYK